MVVCGVQLHIGGKMTLTPLIFLNLLNGLKSKKRGLKGVGYVGNGEPLAYKKFSELVENVGNLNLDQGVFTNGFLIDRFHNQLLNNFTYVRISLDAGSEMIHSELHDAPIHHFKKIISNLELLIKKEKIIVLLLEYSIQPTKEIFMI